MLRSVVADYAFIGADAVHPQYGIASRTLEQSRLKTLMMQRARQIVVVADRRKLSTDQFNYWSPLPAQWRLITDDAADPAALDELRSVGAQIDLTQPLRALTDTVNVKGTRRDNHVNLHRRPASGPATAAGTSRQAVLHQPQRPARSRRFRSRNWNPATCCCGWTPRCCAAPTCGSTRAASRRTSPSRPCWATSSPALSSTPTARCRTGWPWATRSRCTRW